MQEESIFWCPRAWELRWGWYEWRWKVCDGKLFDCTLNISFHMLWWYEHLIALDASNLRWKKLFHFESIYNPRNDLNETIMALLMKSFVERNGQQKNIFLCLRHIHTHICQKTIETFFIIGIYFLFCGCNWKCHPWINRQTDFIRI